MVLSEKRYGVQRILKTGEVHFYDDLNCAMGHQHAEGDGKVFVRPYGQEEWVEAHKVKYVEGLQTPMNSGYGAVTEGGTLGFDEIRKRFKE